MDHGRSFNSRIIIIIDESKSNSVLVKKNRKYASRFYDYINKLPMNLVKEDNEKGIRNWRSGRPEKIEIDSLTVIRARNGKLVVENFDNRRNPKYGKNFSNFNYLDASTLYPRELSFHGSANVLDAIGCMYTAYRGEIDNYVQVLLPDKNVHLEASSKISGDWYHPYKSTYKEPYHIESYDIKQFKNFTTKGFGNKYPYNSGDKIFKTESDLEFVANTRTSYDWIFNFRNTKKRTRL